MFQLHNFGEFNKACWHGNICTMVDFIYNYIDRGYLIGDLETRQFIEIVQDNILKEDVKL